MASYGLTLLVILMSINLFLYIYGVDIPLTTWLNVGATERIGNETVAEGPQAGGLGSTEYLYTILMILSGAIVIGLASSVLANWASGSQSVNWIMPVVIMGVLMVAFFLTPMGNIVGSVRLGSEEICYPMRSGVVMFDVDMTEKPPCLPAIVHILLVMFLGMLIVSTVMSFSRGMEW